jgi:HSP20 family protein
MAVIRWDPWGELQSLQRDLERLFTRTAGEGGERSRSVTPPMDAYRAGDTLVVRIELPGVGPGDVDISVEEGQLTVHASRPAPDDVDEGGWLRRELVAGSYERTFSLPDGADVEGITASTELGILELRIPQGRRSEPRRIKVGTGGEGTGGEGTAGSAGQPVDADDHTGLVEGSTSSGPTGPGSTSAADELEGRESHAGEA